MLTQPEPLQIGEITPYVYQNGYNISDFGSCNGSVNYDVVGGVLPYSYIWEPSQHTIKNPTNLCAYENVVIVSDANGCSINSGIGLSEPQRDDWTMYGNYNSNPTFQFIGSIDNKDVSFRTNNIERFRIKSDGKISMSTFSGTGSKIVYADSLGVLKSFSFLLSTCLPQSPIFPWQANPATPEKVFACGIDFGIGTDSPREKLEVKGTVLVTSWDNSLSSMTDYLFTLLPGFVALPGSQLNLIINPNICIQLRTSSLATIINDSKENTTTLAPKSIDDVKSVLNDYQANQVSLTPLNFNIDVAENLNMPIPSIAIYPNPTSESLTVNFSEKSLSEYTIILYNEQGQIMDAFDSHNQIEVVIDLKSRNNGIYILKAIDRKSNSIEVFKFLKQ